MGGRLDYHLTDNSTVWIDGETSRQQYDNRKGQLGPVGIRGGGYRDELQYQRNKAVIGQDSDLSFGRLSSSLSYAVTENKGRVLTPRSLTPANRNLSGKDRELKNTNTLFNTTLVAPVGADHLLTIGGEYWDARLKDGIVMANSGETFSQHTWSLFSEDDWQIIDPFL